MRNPYLVQFPDLSDNIKRMKTHLLGRLGATLLIATFPNPGLRQLVDAALAWELAETGFMLVERMTATGRLAHLLAHDGLKQPVVVSLLLDTSFDEQRERDKISRFLSRLNRQREILTRQAVSVLLWIQPALLPHFVRKASDLWAWRSDLYEFELKVDPESNHLLTDPVEVRNIAGQVAIVEHELGQLADSKRRLDLTARYIHLADQLGARLPEVEALRQSILKAEDTNQE
jgi:hypothetical protein